MVPAIVCIAASLHALSMDSAIHLHTLVFTSPIREWDTEDLTSILSCVSGEPISDGVLGHPMEMQPTQMQQLISHSLEPQPARLFIEWATFVVPAMVCIASSLHAPLMAYLT